jgi:hypothetical protein
LVTVTFHYSIPEEEKCSDKKNGFTALRITSSRNTTLEQKNSPFKKIFTPKKIIGRIQNVQSTLTKINFNLHSSGRRFLQRSTCFSLCCENNFLQLWTSLPFPGMKIENITPEDTLFGRIFSFFVARLTSKKNPTKKITKITLKTSAKSLTHRSSVMKSPSSLQKA